MKRVSLWLLAIIAWVLPIGAESLCTLTSPNTGLQASLEMSTNIPYLVVRNADGKQLWKVRLGFNTTEENFSTKLSFVDATEPEAITEHYTTLHGKHSEVTNVGNRVTLNFKNSQETPFAVQVRAYDNGITFRYELPSEEDKTYTFSAELTTFEVSSYAHRWIQAFNTSYEGDFPYQGRGNNSGAWCYPALFELNGVFTLLTEANIGRSYSSTHLDNTESVNKYRISYPFDYEGYNVGAVNPSWTGPWTSPWRVLIIGDLKTVVESTLVEDVSDPCKVTNTDFVKPGRAAWVYWAYNHGTQDYQICCKYVDLAKEMGWEYVLFDWEWENMGNGGNIEDAVRYAKNKGIKPMIWYHSNNSKMQNHEERIKEFQWHKKIGIVGVKVDFFESDKQHTMQYFADILEDAAQYGIMVNFHGCTVPRGWSRTYPHLMSQEAVFGGEQYNNGSMMTTEGARINCLLPYTRNVIGPMDYTPVAFTNSQHPHTTSFAHELALSVAFESGIQHWADRPEGFYALPYEAKQHMSNVPVAWDETRFLDGYPGQAFVVARRKGDTWYVSCLNGENKARQQEISLDFLPAGSQLLTCIADGDDEESFNITHRIVTAADNISVSCLPKGGFVLIIGQSTYAEFKKLQKQATTLLNTAKKNVGTEPGQYKEDLVDALETALAEASTITTETPAGQLNAAYATLANAFSALQTRGIIEALFTMGDSVQPKGEGKDVTKTYLREKNGFARSDTERTSSGGYYRFGKPKYWTVENYEINVNETEGIKRGIDNYPGYNCLQLGRWEESTDKLNGCDHANERLYQKVTLPAGRYFFGAVYHYIDASRQGKAYLMVANQPLATNEVESEALAWGTLSTTGGDGSFYGVRFMLTEPQEVVLGWQKDGRNEHCEFRCSEVKLLQYPLPDDQTGIKTVHSSQCTVHNDAVYDLSGRRVLSPKKKGIYIKNGKLIALKK